jgi:xanthine dehydrogenase accessory factor
MKELREILKTVERFSLSPRERAEVRGRSVLATIVKTEGSSYRRPGAHMLILEDGQTIGSISGGCLEQDVIANAKNLTSPKLLTYDTTDEEDVMFGVGLGCKGIIEILLEPISENDERLTFISNLFATRQSGVIVTEIRPNLAARSYLHSDGSFTGNSQQAEGAREALGANRSITRDEVFFQVIHAPPPLYIFGAGFDAIPLARLAKELGYEVTIIDRRPAYATRERFPEADQIIVATPAEIANLPLHERAAAVIMSHHYISDRDYLRALLPRPLRYLGLMGPRRRAEKMLAEFREDGLLIGESFLQQLHNPIGLDIGAEGPEQIALAILSEINTVFTGHGGGILREKKGPIHSPRVNV